MLVVVKNVFIDVETREERQPFEFVDVSEERAKSLIERDLAIAVPIAEAKSGKSSKE